VLEEARSAALARKCRFPHYIPIQTQTRSRSECLLFLISRRPGTGHVLIGPLLWCHLARVYRTSILRHRASWTRSTVSTASLNHSALSPDFLVLNRKSSLRGSTLKIKCGCVRLPRAQPGDNVVNFEAMQRHKGKKDSYRSVDVCDVKGLTGRTFNSVLTSASFRPTTKVVAACMWSLRIHLGACVIKQRLAGSSSEE